MRQGNLLLEVLAKAIHLGAQMVEIEYKDGCERVFAMRNGLGVGIATFKGPEARALREVLSDQPRKKQRFVVDGKQYEYRVQVYDSFNEAAFRIRFKPV
ncbi:MAG: hypothetical protein ACR2L2_05245 [Acidobacteriota bacterium]